MKKYLATLHEKPDHHKKRFALLVSGGFTIILFVGWAIVRFGAPGISLPNPSENINGDKSKVSEVSPVGTLKASVKDAWNSITSQFSEIKKTAGSVDMKDSYQEIRQSALDSYGQ